jgi:hypothetical protein
LKEESERLANLNLNLNMEKQVVDRHKRAAQRAELSARTRGNAEKRLWDGRENEWREGDTLLQVAALVLA